MRLERWTITYKFIFVVALFVLLISRFLVLTENYDWPIDPVKLEFIYLLGVALMALTAHMGKIRLRRGLFWYVLLVMVVHTLLWGKVFVDSEMLEPVSAYFKSQSMFVVIVLVTVLAVHQLNADDAFLQCCYYALSFILLVQLVTNLADVDLSNLANLLTRDQRTRNDFGFGHFNTLGTACACNIILREVVRKRHHSLILKSVDLFILVYTACMLLCSASRSAVTSVAVYYIIYYNAQMQNWPVSRKTLFFLKALRFVGVAAMVAWVVLDFDYTSFLDVAQRGHLVTLVLPMFFSSGKIWLGLGYASNVAYAEGMTPYLTRWLDNGYIYYLVTTGFLGLGLILTALVVMTVAVYKKNQTAFGRETFAAVVAYIYISLFEAVLFNSGGLVNYIYLPWFLLHASKLSNQSEPQTKGIHAAE